MQILEHEDERALLGHRLEEVPPGRERLGAPVSAELALACEADEGQEVRLDPRHVRVARDDFGDGATDLRRGLRRRILLVDPGLRLHDLPERPERDSVPVGEAATLAPGDELGIGVDDLRESS